MLICMVGRELCHVPRLSGPRGETVFVKHAAAFSGLHKMAPHVAALWAAGTEAVSRGGLFGSSRTVARQTVCCVGTGAEIAEGSGYCRCDPFAASTAYN